MSKYTTEVKFICEDIAGKEYPIDDVLSDAWDKIFTTKATIFDEDYRPILCKKILKHYYLREIGAETVGVWRLWMNTKLEEILPMYNQLYKSALLEFDPFNDVDELRVGNRKNTGKSAEVTATNGSTEGTSKTDTSDKSKSSDSTKSDNITRNLYSDTPQGALTGIENNKYLTNATKNTSGTNTSGSASSDSSGTSKNVYDSKSDTSGKRDANTEGFEEYMERITGKRGSQTYMELLKQFRETFLNIDMMIIEEFEELFFGLW